MLHSSRNRLENRVCRSLRKAALYGAALVRRCRPGRPVPVFSYYYYRFYCPPAMRQACANQEGKPSPSRLAGAGWSER
jgi:hypothetical protein